MNKYTSMLLALILTTYNIWCQEYANTNISINPQVDGSLLEPPGSEHLVILIGGSGPVDRDGNQSYSRSNYLKKLAYRLADNNISSFRYDKRIVKQLKAGILNNDTSFNDFVADAKSIIAYFKDQNSYQNIYVLGHSQGSLVGMLSASEDINGFISVNGPAKNIGDTLIQQVGKSAPELQSATEKVVEELKKGKTTTTYPPELANAFNLETQPFLISWMAYDPSEEIKSITIPILIIQGAKDLQVPVEESQNLKSNCNTCSIHIIENMNHMLFEITGNDEMENYKSYSDPNFSISSELIELISDFINID